MQVLKSILLAGAIAFMPAAAFAADLALKPSEPVPPVIEPSFTWTADGFLAQFSARGTVKTAVNL